MEKINEKYFNCEVYNSQIEPEREEHMKKKKTVNATIEEYHTYVSWTYTPKPKTEEERQVNMNLSALFGEIGQMVVNSLK